MTTLDRTRSGPIPIPPPRAADGIASGRIRPMTSDPQPTPAEQDPATPASPAEPEAKAAPAGSAAPEAGAAPEARSTPAVAVIAVPLAVTEMTLVSATVELSVPVATPDAFVGDVGGCRTEWKPHHRTDADAGAAKQPGAEGDPGGIDTDGREPEFRRLAAQLLHVGERAARVAVRRAAACATDVRGASVIMHVLHRKVSGLGQRRRAGGGSAAPCRRPSRRWPGWAAPAARPRTLRGRSAASSS